MLTKPARGLGAVNWLPERDQVVRRVPLLLSIAGTLYPSLPLETLRIANNETTIFVRSSGGSSVTAFGQRTGIEHVRVGQTVLPTDGDGELWLRFTRPDARRYISAHRVLDGTIDAKEVAGRDIIVGTSAVGLLDLRATPLDSAVPGVEVHAQALEQMLNGDHLSRPPFATGLELVYLVAAGAALAWLIGRLGAIGTAAIGAAAIVVVFAASWLAYTNAGYLLDPVYASIAVLLVYLATSLTGYIATERERSRVRSAFGHYVAAPLVEELARNHDKLKLGGETREVTVLFADVRGFTNIAEGLTAEELITFLNRLFTPLSDIILEERGTIDKFMGDAVMAFWNAPLLEEAHATSACRAALRMQEQVGRLNALWAAEAAARGATVAHVQLGIGLNTGDCCVGNVGSPQRFDYSILGDVVNIASRLEGTTKTYGVPIIVGEKTALAASMLAFLEIASVKVRGKERPERIFALIGDEAVEKSETFAKLSGAHARLLAATATADAAAARSVAEGMPYPWRRPVGTTLRQLRAADRKAAARDAQRLVLSFVHQFADADANSDTDAHRDALLQDLTAAAVALRIVANLARVFAILPVLALLHLLRRRRVVIVVVGLLRVGLLRPLWLGIVLVLAEHDIVACEDWLGIDVRGRHDERERVIERDILLALELAPPRGLIDVIGGDADQLAGLVMDEALAALGADLHPALDEQQPRLVGILHEDVEDGAAHGDRGGGRANDVGRLDGDAGDEAERPLNEIHHDGAAADVGVIDELVEQQPRSRPEGQFGAVVQLDLAAAVRVGLDQLLLTYVVAARQTPLVAAGIQCGRDIVDDGDRRADRIIWSRGRAASEREGQGE